jgi:hypothetical protein
MQAHQRIESKCLFGTVGDHFEVYALHVLVKGGSFPVRLVRGEQQQQQQQQELHPGP